jgi:hypothetical protein
MRARSSVPSLPSREIRSKALAGLEPLTRSPTKSSQSDQVLTTTPKMNQRAKR